MSSNDTAAPVYSDAQKERLMEILIKIGGGVALAFFALVWSVRMEDHTMWLLLPVYVIWCFNGW
jgi:hypothetical protein